MTLQDTATPAPVQTAEPTGPVTDAEFTPAKIDTKEDLAAAFQQQLDAEAGTKPEPAAKAAPNTPAPADAAQQATEVEAAAETTAEAAPDSDPATDPATLDVGPSGMSEADRAAFDKLPPEQKAWVSERAKAMQADYTRKTQAIAETTKAVTAERQALNGALQYYDQLLSSVLQAPKLSPPDPALRESDPAAFEQKLAEYVHAEHAQKVAAQEREKVREQQKAIQARQDHEFFTEQERVLAEAKSPLGERTPTGALTPQALSLRKSCFEYGVKTGIPPEVINKATAVELMLLDKARRYDAAQAASAAAKTVPTVAPKVSKPGPAKAIGRPSNASVAIQNLSQNASRENLAAAFEAQLRAERNG
jgi:hypothetical protein